MPQIATNKRALHDYQVLEKLSAGIVLSGPEVKSAKAGQVNLRGSFAILKGEELWLTGCHIGPYKPAISVQAGYVPTRDRRLLIRREEIRTLIGKMRQAGLTLLPLSVYTLRGLVKVELGLCRGKKAHDKREAIKRREVERDIRRAIRNKPL